MKFQIMRKFQSRPPIEKVVIELSRNEFEYLIVALGSCSLLGVQENWEKNKAYFKELGIVDKPTRNTIYSDLVYDLKTDKVDWS